MRQDISLDTNYITDKKHRTSTYVMSKMDGWMMFWALEFPTGVLQLLFRLVSLTAICMQPPSLYFSHRAQCIYRVKG